MEKKPIVLYKKHVFVFLIILILLMYETLKYVSSETNRYIDIKVFVLANIAFSILPIFILIIIMMIKFVPWERSLSIKTICVLFYFNGLILSTLRVIHDGAINNVSYICVAILELILISCMILLTKSLLKHKDKYLTEMYETSLLDKGEFIELKSSFFSIAIFYSSLFAMLLIVIPLLVYMFANGISSISIQVIGTIINSFCVCVIIIIILLLVLRRWLKRVLTIYHNDEYIIGRNFLGNSYVIKREMVDSIKIKSALFFQIIVIRSDRLKKTVYMPYYSFSKRNIMELLTKQ